MKYTKGEAHELIEQGPSFMDYSHAQQLLRESYGDPHIKLSTYKKEVRNWLKLKFDVAKELEKFTTFW